MACKIEKAQNGKINKVKDENGETSRLFQQIFNVPILTLEQSIQVYQNTFSIKSNIEDSAINNIDYIFKENANLSQIGTEVEYAQYLKSIFPNTKVNSVLYHGTKRDFNNFDEQQIGTESDKNKTIGDFGQGFYFTEIFDRAYGYSIDMSTGNQVGRVIPVIVNVENPDMNSQKSKEELNQEGFDGVVVSYKTRAYDEVVVPNVNQIHILGTEEDIESFKNWKKTYSKENNLTFETLSGESFSTYQQALQNSTTGMISLKVGDKVMGQVNSDTSIDTYPGILNHLIKNGVLDGTRTLDVNGDVITNVNGQTDTARQLSSNIAEDILVKQLGQSSVVRLATGDFILENNLNTRIIGSEKVDQNEISELSFEQLKNKFGEEQAIEIEVEREFEKGKLPNNLKKRIDEETEIKTEDELVRSIKSLLNKLGVKITSIEEYINNNKLKNEGVPATSSALMDVVNKIMAFKDGNITRQDLIEETMHLIEASLDPTTTEGVRRNIHITPEWKEHSQHYYEVYSKEYSGNKLEEMVRREILGKVMANAVANNFQLSQDATLTEQSIFSKIIEFLDTFFQRLNTYFNSDAQTQIDNLNKDIYVKLLSGELVDDLNPNQNFGTKFRLYSSSNNLSNDLVQIQRQAEETLNLLRSQTYEIARNDYAQRQQLTQAEESLGRVGEQFEQIAKTTDVVEKGKLEKVAQSELAATFSHLTNVAQKQLTYLQRAVKRNEQGNYHFSAEEDAVYNTLISQFDNQILPSIKHTLENKKLRSKAENRILEEVNKVSDSIEKLKGQVSTAENNYKNHLVDLLVRRLDLSQDKRAFIQNKVDNLQAETNFFFMNFGTLMHSSNLYLNAAAHVSSKVDHEKRQATLEQTLPFVKKLQDLGWINKVKEFAKDGFIENRFNDKLREDALAEARYNIYKEISGEDLTQEEFEKKKLSGLTTAQKTDFNKKLQDWQLDNFTLSALSPEETRERRKRLENYSLVTQNYERNSSLFYANLMQNAEIVNGVPTFTTEMKYDYEQRKKERVYDKSVFNIEGDLREGIELRTEAEYELSPEQDIVKISNNIFVSLKPGTTDNPSILSFELTKLDNLRLAEIKENNEEKEFSQTFVDTLSEMTPSDAYDFLMLNAYVGYTNEYYDRLNRPSILDKLNDELGGDNDWKIQNLIDKIASTTKKMNTILQANKVMNNPSEVSYENMEKSTEVGMVKQYAQDLEDYYSQASNLVSRSEEIEEDNISETIPNESFVNYMADKHLVFQLDYNKEYLNEDEVDNINKIFSEIIEHSTQKNKKKVLELRSFVKDFSRGAINRIPKEYKKVFNLSESDYNEMSEEQLFASMTNDLLQYSYTRLLPYFRKSQPTGVDIALSDLRNNKISASDFLKNYQEGQYEYLNISPNYAFQQANEANNKNPHFNQAKLQGTPLFRTFEVDTTLEDVKNKSVDQLYKEGKLNKYVNKEFLKEYNIDLVQLFETGEETTKEGTPKQIQDKFDARQEFVKLQKQTVENYGMTNSHNIYLLPQKEKGKLRKWEDIVNKKQGVRGLVDELINFREDDASLGQDSAGNTAKNMVISSIPKLGLRKLNQGEATDELLESYIWMNKESNLYKARKANIGDMLAIKKALLGSQFENNLAVESSNVYKMFEDSMKHNFYGVKETFSKEFQLFGVKGNWGSVLKSFGAFIRFRNLAYNLTIPITSALSGSVQLRIEKIVGERVDRSALDRANKIFKDTAGDSTREVMDFQTTSWLNSMGAKWGWFETEEKYNNSNYGKAVRGLGRSAYVAHTMFNFPINPRTGLAVLCDHRFVDGKLIQYRDFKENNKGKSDKEIREIWKQYKDITDVSKVSESGVVTYDYQKIADELNTGMTAEEAKEFMDGKDAGIASRVKLAIQAVDQQISESDRSMAARNAIFSFLTTHRSWLYLAAQSKFKGRQLNTLSGNIEEGSWRTPWRVVSSIVDDVKSGKTKDIVKYIKERWENGNTTTRKNLIRGVTEMTVLNLMIGLLVMGLKELDDDDKDSYAFQVANLFLMRTTSEVMSSSIGVPSNIYGTLNDAVVGLNTIDMAFDIGDIGSSEIVQKGRYSGLTERERYFYKYVPLAKDYNSLFRDVSGSLNAYRFFNLEDNKTLDYLSVYPLLVDEEEN